MGRQRRDGGVEPGGDVGGCAGDPPQATDVDEAARAGDRLMIYETSGRIIDMTYSDGR